MLERLCQYESTLGELLQRTRLSHPDHAHLLQALRRAKSCSEEDLHSLNAGGYCISPNLDQVLSSDVSAFNCIRRPPSPVRTTANNKMTPQSRTLSVSTMISNSSTLVPPTRKSGNKGTTTSSWYASKSTGSLLQDCVDATAISSNIAAGRSAQKKSRKSAINWPFRKSSSKLAKKSASTKSLVASDAHSSGCGNENGNDSGVSLDFSSSSSTSSSASCSGTFASVFSSSHTTTSHNKHSKPTKLFGQSIGKLCQDGKLILPIMNLLNELMAKGPHTIGIFRKSANARICRDLKTQLEQTPDRSIKEFPVTVIASVLKELLRSLPDCLLQSKLYLRWMEAMNDKLNVDQSTTKVRLLLQQMQPQNLLLLRHLLCLLHCISAHSQMNKMTSINLGVCIGPSLLSSKHPPSSQRCEELSKQVPKLIAFLIDHCSDLLGSTTLSLLRECPDEEVLSLNTEISSCVDSSLSTQRDYKLPNKDSGAEESDTMPSLGDARDETTCEQERLDHNSTRLNESRLRPFPSSGSKHSLQQLSSTESNSSSTTPCTISVELPSTMRLLGNKNSLSNLSRDSGLTLSDTQLYSPAEDEEEEDDYQHVINHHLQLSSKLAALGNSCPSSNASFTRPRANSIARTKSVALERQTKNCTTNIGSVCSTTSGSNDEEETPVFEEQMPSTMRLLKQQQQSAAAVHGLRYDLRTNSVNIARPTCSRTVSLEHVSSAHTLRLPVRSPEHIYSSIQETLLPRSDVTRPKLVRSQCLSSTGSEDVFFNESSTSSLTTQQPNINYGQQQNVVGWTSMCRLPTNTAATYNTTNRRSVISVQSIPAAVAATTCSSSSIPVQPPSYQDTMSRKQQTARQLGSITSALNLSPTSPQLTARAIPVRVGSPSQKTDSVQPKSFSTFCNNFSRFVDVVDGAMKSSKSVLVQQRSAKDMSEHWRNEIHSSVSSLRDKFARMAAAGRAAETNSVSRVVQSGPLSITPKVADVLPTRSACKSLGSLHDLLLRDSSTQMEIKNVANSACNNNSKRNVTIIQVLSPQHRRHSLSSSEEESYV